MFAFLSVGWYVGICGLVAVVAIFGYVFVELIRAIPDEADQEEMQRVEEDCEKLRKACCKAQQAQEPRTPSPEYLQAIRRPSTN